ncbi:MAG: GntR family transcriptional regulator [Gemmatimonadota bacterium]
MPFELSDADRRPLYLQIMDEVKRSIVLGTIRPDEPLPSVRQLAAELRINPNTVAQAYRELERDGVVYVRRGQGTFIAQNSGGADERAELLRAVAERAARDAFRNGLSIADLISALRAREPAESAI